MSLENDFLKIYDTVTSKAGVVHSHTQNQWLIQENKDRNPPCLNDLTLTIQGAVFSSFNECIFKNMPNVTTDFSTQMNNFECDGFSFVSKNGEERLCFVELKSTFATQHIGKAIAQMTSSFFKFYSLASPIDVALFDKKIHFIVACQFFKNSDQRDWAANYADKQTMLPETNMLAELLQGMIASGTNTATKEFALGEFYFDDLDAVPEGTEHRIKTFPYAQKLKDLKINLTLVMTDSFGNSSASLNLN